MFANAYIPRIEAIIIGVTLRKRITIDAERLKKLSKCSTLGEVFDSAEHSITTPTSASSSAIEIDYAITLYRRLKEAAYNVFLASGKEKLVSDKKGVIYSYPTMAVLYQLESGWFVADLSKIVSSQTLEDSVHIPLQLYMARENIDKVDLYDPLCGYPNACMHMNTVIMSKSWKNESPVYSYKGDIHSLNNILAR